MCWESSAGSLGSTARSPWAHTSPRWTAPWHPSRRREAQHSLPETTGDPYSACIDIGQLLEVGDGILDVFLVAQMEPSPTVAEALSQNDVAALSQGEREPFQSLIVTTRPC